MGSDLLCFLQDEETKELIVAALQAKVSPPIDARTWCSAMYSVTPPNFLHGGGKYEAYEVVRQYLSII
jgi:hypothetical protein